MGASVPNCVAVPSDKEAPAELGFTHHDLSCLPAFGVGTLAAIDAALAEHGLRLDKHEPHQPTLLEEFATVLEQRDQLLALIERITDTVSTVEGLSDIDTTLGGMDTKPTVRQASTTYNRDNRR